MTVLADILIGYIGYWKQCLIWVTSLVNNMDNVHGRYKCGRYVYGCDITAPYVVVICILVVDIMMDTCLNL